MELVSCTGYQCAWPRPCLWGADSIGGRRQHPASREAPARRAKMLGLRLRTVVGLLGLCSMLLAPAPAWGQATTGELAGRVTDSGGAVVPGVTVTALNDATGFSRTTLTSAGGDFLITLLPPGRYTVSAELSGFRRAVRRDVEVNIGTRQTLGFELGVGNMTEEVVVSGQSPMVETTRSDIGGVVTPNEITNLPLLNRTFANLAVIMPEARPSGNFDP